MNTEHFIDHYFLCSFIFARFNHAEWVSNTKKEFFIKSARSWRAEILVARKPKPRNSPNPRTRARRTVVVIVGKKAPPQKAEVPSTSSSEESDEDDDAEFSGNEFGLCHSDDNEYLGNITNKNKKYGKEEQYVDFEF